MSSVTQEMKDLMAAQRARRAKRLEEGVPLAEYNPQEIVKDGKITQAMLDQLRRDFENLTTAAMLGKFEHGGRFHAAAKNLQAAIEIVVKVARLKL